MPKFLILRQNVEGGGVMINADHILYIEDDVVHMIDGTEFKTECYFNDFRLALIKVGYKVEEVWDEVY